LVCLSLCIGWVQAATESSVVVTGAWSRATTPGAITAAVYLQITNESNQILTLNGIETPVAAHAHIHKTVSKDGVMNMTPIGKLTVASGSRIEFGPGGLHVMLKKLTRPLTEGETFPIRLKFHQHPDLDVDVLVGAVGQIKAP